MQRILHSRWFTFSDVFLVLVSGMILYLWPAVGGWSLIPPLLPWCLRYLSGEFQFQPKTFDWLIAIFVITALVGYWAAYDKNAALHKFWLILLAALFYYAVSKQPGGNLGWLSGIFFSIGVGISLYFFLTHDFVALPRKLQIVNGFGQWIMEVRPHVSWKPIHPNYVAGVAAITAPFGLYPLWKIKNQASKSSSVWYVAIPVTYLLLAFTIFMATSRGVILALFSAAGVWIVWKIVSLTRINFPFGNEAFFPLLVLCYLAIVVLFLYLGPASFTGSAISPNDYGTGTRAEVFTRSLYFLEEFPFTGSGLGTFPGIYSFYILGIPFFYIPNSHNLFLDVAIEQGILAGLCYLFLFLGSVWYVARASLKTPSVEVRFFSWLVLFALIIALVHGMVDDYLYNGNGALLALFLVGASTLIKREGLPNEGSPGWFDYRIPVSVIIILIVVCLFNLNRIRSLWYSDLGAVQMQRVELAGFPSTGWIDSKVGPQLLPAEVLFNSALRYDRNNRTANYRLGLISMLRQDFASAAGNLETAYKEMPSHRGVIKNLGYCYVWLGEMNKAKVLLARIPEAQKELDVYVWWWGVQGRKDLAENAYRLAPDLNSQSYQP